MDAFTFHNPTKNRIWQGLCSSIRARFGKIRSKRAVNLWRWQY